MKKLHWLSLCLLILFVCCKNDEQFGDVSNPKAQTLVATYAGESDSKAVLGVDGNNVSLSWEKGDCFSVYKIDGDSSALVGDFTLSSLASKTSTFTANKGVRLIEGENYQAVYPSSSAPTLASRDTIITTLLAQSAIKRDGTSAFFMKSGQFKYSASENNITFGDDLSSSDVTVGYYRNKTSDEVLAIVVTIGEKTIVVPVK